MLSRRRPHPAQRSCFKQDKREVIAIDLRPPQVKFSLSLSRGISLCPVLVEQTEQNVFTVSNFRFFSSRRPVCLHMVLIWIGLGGCVRSYLFVLNEPQRGVDLARGWFLTFPDLCSVSGRVVASRGGLVIWPLVWNESPPALSLPCSVG